MAQEVIVRAPFDGVTIGERPLAEANDLEQMFEKAGRAKGGAVPLSQAERCKILEKTADLVAQDAERFAFQAAAEGGKPLVDSRIELERAVQGIREAAYAVRQLVGEEIPMNLNEASSGRLAFTVRESIGIVTSIGAFNHPFNLAVHQMIPALAAGCPVIFKPALKTPLSAFNLLDCLYQAGLPTPWADVLLCANDLAEKMACDPRSSLLSFVGSAKVGWMLRSKLPPGTRCLLEHGGAAPALFFDDADLNTALPLLLKGGFYHAGQVCVSLQRLYCQSRVLEELCERLIAGATKQIVGDPLDEKTTVGPLISPTEVDRVATIVSEAVKAGGKLLCGGHKISATCYAPTLILNPPDTCRLSQEEIFGPVIAIYSFDQDEAAIRRANNIPYAFQAAVFGRDLDRVFTAARQLKAAAVMINDHTAFRVDWMPFGGQKASGLGVGGILPTMKAMTEEKLIIVKSPAFLK